MVASMKWVQVPNGDWINCPWTGLDKLGIFSGFHTRNTIFYDFLLCFSAHRTPSEKGSPLKGIGSKCFSFKVEPFSEGRQNLVWQSCLPWKWILKGKGNFLGRYYCKLFLPRFWKMSTLSLQKKNNYFRININTAGWVKISADDILKYFLYFS